MSKSINVNPDHYKVAGREHQGDAILQNRHKQKLRTSKEERRRNFIPGEPPVGETRRTAPGIESKPGGLSTEKKAAPKKAASRSGVNESDAKKPAKAKKK